MCTIPKILMSIAVAFSISSIANAGPAGKPFVLKNDKIEVAIDNSGRLVSLKNVKTGTEYAAGDALWRLYYDTHEEKEIQVLGSEQTASVTSKGNTIIIRYDKMKVPVSEYNGRGDVFRLSMTLKVILEDDMVRFTSEMANNEPHTIVREFQYPLVGDMPLSDDFKLLITDTGGQLYSDIKETIMKNSNTSPYKSPAQFFRQWDIKYPTRIAANCFAFITDTEGLYFGSHDNTFQDTWHGFRLYPDQNREFNRLEAGFYKYPDCLYGETWKCDANVVAPYSGSWHETSRFYRRWADTWWEKRQPPMWIRQMNSWHRVILKHQYGEYLFTYKDINGHMKDVANSVNADVLFTFGWWKNGMDNGYPAYDADPAQGGDAAWKQAISDYRKSGGHIILYFNGKLIDRESDFYKNGPGKDICYKDNTGGEFIEQYKFTGMGTFLGDKNPRSFVVADSRNKVWKDMLIQFADRAYDYGANSVFFDQMGYGERTTNWDNSKEFPIPNLFTVADKAQTLKMIRDHIAAKDPDFGLGTEWLTDATCQMTDFTHVYTTTAGPHSFMDWFRYTFPEVIISDREVRDDTDIERRVNNTLLVGLRNDIEIYRCRDMIDDTPHYQAYLAKVNAIKSKYSDLLLMGTFKDCDGFECSEPKLSANAFINGSRMAIVATNTTKNSINAVITVPGYKYVESALLGQAKVSADGSSLTLGQYDLAVLIYEKN